MLTSISEKNNNDVFNIIILHFQNTFNLVIIIVFFYLFLNKNEIHLKSTIGETRKKKPVF